MMHRDDRLEKCLGFYAVAGGNPPAVVGYHDKLRGCKAANGSASVVRPHIIFPSTGNPRWIFPASSPIILRAGHLVKPSRFLSRLFWQIFKAAACLRLPLHKLFPTIETCGGPGGRGALSAHFTSAIGAGDQLDFILYTGAKGLYQKYTAQVMKESGAVVCFAKISDTEAGKKQLLRERDNLLYINKQQFQHFLVPKLLPMNPFGSFTVLALSPPPQQFHPHLENVTPLHARAVGELFNKLPGRDSSVEELVEVRARLLEGTTVPATFEGAPAIVAKAFIFLRREAKGAIPLGFSHGDYTAWNCFIKDSRLFLYDWELGDYRTPFWDLYNYLLHHEILVENRSPGEAVKRIESVHLPVLQAYREEARLPGHVCAKTCLVFYLLDIYLYYLGYISRHLADRYVVSTESQRLAAAAEAMLGMVVCPDKV